METFDDQVSVAGITLFRAAFAARSSDGAVATGAAASRVESPRNRAWAELLERASIIDAIAPGRTSYVTRTQTGAERPRLLRSVVFRESSRPEQRVHARSNGVALASSWPQACHRALLEAVERHRVLRSWIGCTRPTWLDAPGPWPTTQGYRWEAYTFPADDKWVSGVEVVGVFAFPLRGDLPLLRGWAADTDRGRAWNRALGECFQGLAFLHDETLPEREPRPEPTAAYHLDLFLWAGTHERLQAWLRGSGVHRCAPSRSPVGRGVRYVDLTPGSGLGWRVAKALPAGATPLSFGEAPDLLRGGLPHPIP